MSSERSQTKTIVIAALALVVTFIAGFIVGAVVDRFLTMHRPGFRRPPAMVADAMLERLDNRLDLTDQQRVQIESILEKRHERIHSLQESIHPKVQAEIQQTNAEIERVLTPEQREKFQKLKMRMHPRGKGRKGPTR